MTSHRSLVIPFLSLSLLAGRCLFADDVPKRLAFDRYSGMMNRSPFAVATAVAPPAATPSFAKELYVANTAHTKDEDLVTIMSSTDKGFKEYLSTRGPNDHGYAIATIEWSELPGGTKVTISKDNQFATLTFNQALMAQSPASIAPPGPGGVVVPGAAPTPIPPYVPPRPANVSSYPTPPPHVRGVIQRNPAGQSPQSLPRPSVSDQSVQQ